MSKDQVHWLKESGNQSLKAGKYAEALLHYTHAIKLNSNDSKLYSNRSLAFLKLDQYYYAIQDAEEVIKLNPSWSKGYFRKAEVEAEAGLYDEALESYRRALQQDSGNAGIYLAMKKVKEKQQKRESADFRVPWLGLVIGMVVGMTIVAYDGVAHKDKAFLSHIWEKLLVVAVCGVGVFYLAKVQRSYVKNYRESLLKPPLDLFLDQNSS